MAKRVLTNGNPLPFSPEELETLYQQLLECFYEEDNREKASKVASRLEEALAVPEYGHSIRGEEVRSIIAELRGDYAEAIRSREAEVRKVLELHTLTLHTRRWPYVAERYGFADVSDRLDLLAILYDKQGDTDRAIAVLLESKEYCRAHDVPFDGQDLLDELEKAQPTPRKRSPVGRRLPRLKR